MKNISLKKISTAFFIFLCVIAISAGSASYGYMSSTGGMIKTVEMKVHKQECKSHMQTASYTQKSLQFDNEREKSKAMAVGILFGARYAVSSNEDRAASKAQAIKSYRTCLKKRALKS